MHRNETMAGAAFCDIFVCYRDFIVNCIQKLFLGNVSMCHLHSFTLCSTSWQGQYFASVLAVVCVVTKQNLSRGHRCAYIGICTQSMCGVDGICAVLLWIVRAMLPNHGCSYKLDAGYPENPVQRYFDVFVW